MFSKTKKYNKLTKLVFSSLLLQSIVLNSSAIDDLEALRAQFPEEYQQAIQLEQNRIAQNLRTSQYDLAFRQTSELVEHLRAAATKNQILQVLQPLQHNRLTPREEVGEIGEEIGRELHQRQLAIYRREIQRLQEAERTRQEQQQREAERTRQEQRLLEAERTRQEQRLLEAERTRQEQRLLEAERTRQEQQREAERTRQERQQREAERIRQEQRLQEAERTRQERQQREAERIRQQQQQREAERTRQEQQQAEKARLQQRKARTFEQIQEAEILRYQQELAETTRLREEFPEAYQEALKWEKEQKINKIIQEETLNEKKIDTNKIINIPSMLSIIGENIWFTSPRLDNVAQLIENQTVPVLVIRDDASAESVGEYVSKIRNDSKQYNFLMIFKYNPNESTPLIINTFKTTMDYLKKNSKSTIDMFGNDVLSRIIIKRAKESSIDHFSSLPITHPVLSQ